MADENQNQCPFCAIAENKLPTVKIYEDNAVIAVLDIHPASKGHIVVFPKQHFSFLYELPNNILSQVFIVAKSLSSAAIEAFGATGVNIVYSMGASAGQRVPHVLVNIIPRYENDGIKVEWSNKEVSQDELADSFKKISSVMQKNTIETLKAIKEGKLKVPDEVKKQAEKLLSQVENKKETKTVNSLEEL
ncbi:MAG: HIT family protein [Candidatus Nanoarchaeia archaeon]|nr:HIT family protein [Candidatus Nanoarchaeia archaeon]